MSRALEAVVQALVPADRQEEFLGDLLEEARGRSWWPWGQILRSLPSLVAWRWGRRLGAARLATATGAAWDWSLPAACSLSAHALLIGGLAAWMAPRRPIEPPPMVEHRAHVSLPAWRPARNLTYVAAARLCLDCAAPHGVVASASMMVKACVDEQGLVSSVSILRGAAPVVEEEVLRTVRRWRFTPAFVDGQARSFCFASRFVFSVP